MTDIADLRSNVDAWVARTYPGGTYFDRGGQRLIYRLANENAALKIWSAVPPDQHERHVREVSALAALDHQSLPGVVAYLSQVEIAGQQCTFYLEEWLDAPSLKSQGADLPLTRARFDIVAATTADAVRTLHEANIVHRDISFGNVLIGEDRGFVIDLGLAKHFDLDSLTGTGIHLAHTPNTASPEQLRGNSSDLRSSTDIFSLGVVLAYALTGKHPYLDDGEAVEPGTYLERLLAHDRKNLPDNGIGTLIVEMLHPVAMYRPTAAAVVERLS